MYSYILVALDGSQRAEQILPYVEPLVEKFGSRVTLVRSTTSVEMLAAESAPVTGPDGAAFIDPVPIVDAEREDASRYLEALAERLRSRGYTVRTDLAEGPAARAIVEGAQRRDADLIAMTTHGRGGIGRLIFGSVAEEVLRHAPCPILLVRVSETAES